MRANVTNAASSVIATGPGTFLIRNVTGTATIFLESDQPASEDAGFEWLTGDGCLEVTLWGNHPEGRPPQQLFGIVVSGGAEQHLHVLLTATLALSA